MASFISENQEFILQAYRSGKSGNEIADSLKISRQTLYNYLNKLNIRVIDKKIEKLKSLMEQEKLNILSLYFDGNLTMEEIGSIYDTWGNNISEYFKRWGIKAREGSIGKPSRLERKFRDEFLKDIRDDEIKPQYKIDGRFYDFYIPKLNLLIEINGDYWHGNPKVFKKLNKYQKMSKKRDVIKKGIAHKNNFKLVFIWEYDMENNTKKITTTLKKYGIK